MLLGTLLVPHVTGPWLTYSALFLLVTLHLFINYFAVCGLELRSLNRQRAGLAWNSYRLSTGSKVPSPTEVSRTDNILGKPDVFRDDNGHSIGRCTIGSCFTDVFHDRFPAGLLEMFAKERYLVWYDHQCLYLRSGREDQDVRSGPIYLHIMLKDGYTGADQLKAWCQAAELCRLSVESTGIKSKTEDDDRSALKHILTTLQSVSRNFPTFLQSLRRAGWNTDDIAILAGSPKAVLTGVEPTDKTNRESKKSR
ncbi:hypothetical protein C0991_003498 [Blastosporella zonata]|nr:hypothetical protein C0991_003498 [Blastosporella zonata]